MRFIFIIFFTVVLNPNYSQDLKIKYIDSDHTYNSDFTDGQMLHSIGTHNIQILRANRSYPESAEGLGWTYNHAPFLSYWKGYFYCQYLSTPMGEHSSPGVSLITRSKDGYEWDKPKIIFPIYFDYHKSDKYVDVKNLIMHQRMAFHVSTNGKLLVFGHYGGNNGDGVGRVVREVFEDFTYGPIYFIRLNESWKGNISYPYYKTSEDKGFIFACEEFVKDPIKRIQWWEEDYLSSDSGKFYLPFKRQKAFTFYSISDKIKIGLFKSRMVNWSMDGGNTWSKPERSESLKYGGAKIWGQKLDSNLYAIVYNPTDNKNRHPMGVATSKDGIKYQNLSLVHGEVPLKRYWGIEKRPGPQYVRGISEGNGNPPGDDLWVVYSVSKEDIWISKIPFPISTTWEGTISDDFNNPSSKYLIENWNIYSPKWCPIIIENGPNGQGKSLVLEDFDPYDYAKAVRTIDNQTQGNISMDFYVESVNDPFFVDITDKFGKRLISLKIDKIDLLNVIEKGDNSRMEFILDQKSWNKILILYNSKMLEFKLKINQNEITKSISFLNKGIPNRVELRTGKYRMDRKIQEYKSNDQKVPGWDEPNSERPSKSTKIYIDNFISGNYSGYLRD